MKLNLGCGRVYLDGYLNVDMLGGELQAEATRLPFKNDIFEEVLISHVLEHIRNVVDAIHEIHRILKSGGLLKVIVPYGLKSIYTAAHLHPFNLMSLKNFCLEESHTISSFQSESLFRMVEKKITNWSIPFMYHIHKHITGNFPSLRITWTNDVGRVKTRLPLGPRSEVTFWMVKR